MGRSPLIVFGVLILLCVPLVTFAQEVPALKPDEVPVSPIGQAQAASAFGHGNLMQTSKDRRARTSTLVEYDREGNVVQAIGLPATQSVEENRFAGSAVGSDGRVHFYHGVFDAELASLELATGKLTGRRFRGMAMPGVTYYGHLAALGPYVFCTDYKTAPNERGQQGVVRFNVETGEAHRGFAESSPVDVYAGFDGWLYVLDDNQTKVHVVHPVSMTAGERFSLPKRGRALGVERRGTIIIAGEDDYIYRVDREGNVLATSPEKRGGLCDVDIDEDGTILVASFNGVVTILDESLAFAKTIERKDASDSFASWVKAPPALTQAAPPTQVTEIARPTRPDPPPPMITKTPSVPDAATGVAPSPILGGENTWLIAILVGATGIAVVVGVIMVMKRKNAATAQGDIVELDDEYDEPAPIAARRPGAGKDYSPADLRLLGTCQRGILLCVLLQIVLFALAASALKDLPVITLALGIPVTIFAVIMVFKLAARLHGETAAIVLTILTAVPLIGLFVLLSINGKTTRILRENNIPVGFMGADPSKLPPADS